MHVLFLNTRDSLGADVAVHISLARFLDRRTTRVSAATMLREAPGDSARAAFASIPDLTLLPLDLGRPMSSQRGLAARARALLDNLRGASTLLSLALWCRRQHVDVVHVTDRPRDALFGTILAQLAGCACVIHAHTSYYPHPPSAGATLMDWLLRHADAVVGVSEFTANTFVHTGHVDRRKVFAVHNAVDYAVLSGEQPSEHDRVMLRQQFGIAPEAPLIGCVGRLIQGKDQASLIEALALVRAEMPSVRLLIVGESGDRAPDGNGTYGEFLRRRVASLGLEDMVAFTGLLPCASVRQLYAALDLFVHPCVEEPFGLVLVEAMANSRPVVAVGRGGVPEIIRDGVDGLLVPPRDPAALAGGILRVLRDRQLAGDLAQAGRKRVLCAFTPEIQTATMQGVYRKVLRRS